MIQKTRKKIDSIDDRILALLTKRVQAVCKVNRVKDRKKIETFSAEREAEILRRLKKLNLSGLKDADIEMIFTDIFSVFRSLRGRLMIAFLGPEGTFTHQAAVKKFGKKVDFLPRESIEEVFSAVEKGHADYGVVPVENSHEGVINYTLDMLCDSPLKICAEVAMPISHNLLAKKAGARIKKIYSNPEVFAQCRKWLTGHMPQVELVPVLSTARAACEARQDSGAACIGSRVLASLYGLKILKTSVEDSTFNITRFLIIARNDSSPSGKDKTSLLFSVKDKVGALYDALYSFKKFSINMTRIESRPSKRKAWEYYFFVDLEGHRSKAIIKKCINELEKRCNFVKILGSYPKEN